MYVHIHMYIYMYILPPPSGSKPIGGVLDWANFISLTNIADLGEEYLCPHQHKSKFFF